MFRRYRTLGVVIAANLHTNMTAPFTTLLFLASLYLVRASTYQPIVSEHGVSQWNKPKCSDIENIAMNLPDSGSTLTKTALKSVARCVDNNTCCGEVSVLETTEGIVISAYRPHALKCGKGAITAHLVPNRVRMVPWWALVCIWLCYGLLFLGNSYNRRQVYGGN